MNKGDIELLWDEKECPALLFSGRWSCDNTHSAQYLVVEDIWWHWVTHVIMVMISFNAGRLLWYFDPCSVILFLLDLFLQISEEAVSVLQIFRQVWITSILRICVWFREVFSQNVARLKLSWKIFVNFRATLDCEHFDSPCLVSSGQPRAWITLDSCWQPPSSSSLKLFYICKEKSKMQKLIMLKLEWFFELHVWASTESGSRVGTSLN